MESCAALTFFSKIDVNCKNRALRCAAIVKVMKIAPQIFAEFTSAEQRRVKSKK
jgi:hypothetical protein